jgi:hypothetical protein
MELINFIKEKAKNVEITPYKHQSQKISTKIKRKIKKISHKKRDI